jgi:hypothetical protein
LHDAEYASLVELVTRWNDLLVDFEYDYPHDYPHGPLSADEYTSLQAIRDADAAYTKATGIPSELPDWYYSEYAYPAIDRK